MREHSRELLHVCCNGLRMFVATAPLQLARNCVLCADIGREGTSLSLSTSRRSTRAIIGRPRATQRVLLGARGSAAQSAGRLDGVLRERGQPKLLRGEGGSDMYTEGAPVSRKERS
jgi:hypothetical protein